MNIFKKVLTILFLIIQLSNLSNAQIAINSDGSAPDASAMLEITSSNKGILIPRVTTAERTAITSPATGLMVYDTDENSFWYYNGTAWSTIGGGAGFTSESGITHSNNNDDDFLFGVDSLNHGSGLEAKMFFDKDKGAFRVGGVSDDSWDESNIGTYSTAFGRNTEASGEDATSFGLLTTASGATSTAFGLNAVASGDNSTAFGYGTAASGTYSTAFGYDTEASESYSIAFGYDTEASGSYSTVFGYRSKASGPISASFGGYTEASGNYSTSFGSYTTASGNYATSFGRTTTAYSYAETALGSYNTTYTPNNSTSYDSGDRLFVIGNGTSSSNLSDALIIYKNGNTELNGSLAIDSDSSSSPDASAILDLTSTDKGILIPRMTTGERTVISSPAVGLLVYDTDENSFWYYNGSTWTAIGGSNGFTSDNGITYSNNNDDDFLFGADDLEHTSSSSTYEYKMFFDKSKGAFRAGSVNSTQWDESNVGTFSFSVGGNNTASGDGSIGLGYYTTASGKYATTFGRSTTASSYSEFVIGTFNTSYSPNSTSSFNSADRLFVIGNGEYASNSDAMIVYKSGDTEINGSLTINNAFSFPTIDGTDGQMLKTDGAGTLTWGNSAIISDADDDTKIQVEESSDEDIIRFDLGGTEFMRLDNGRIEVLNTGNSIFLGEGAGQSDNLSDNRNIFIGYEAGTSTLTGENNTFIGYQSGKDNTTGDDNTFIGYQSGENNTTGRFNTFIGEGSGSSNKTGESNAFLGNQSGGTNTGNDNVFLGSYAGFLNAGNENTFIGSEAGHNAYGNNNVFIGYQAGYNETDNDKLYIANSNTLSPLIYGEFDNDILEFNASVGINTTPDNATFEVSGSGSSLASYTYGYLNNSGTTGLWTASSTYSIYADGKIGGYSFHAHSDERIKNIQGISNSAEDLKTIMDIQITNYTLKDTIANGNQSTKKVIAQQVKSVYPQAVSSNTTQVIPDIYQAATIDENGWVTVETLQCNVSIGEKIQIIFDDKKEVLEVLETKANAFRVNSKPATVFIYGRQVKDFHTVDYEAISMLNVSATQQLAKENEQLKKEVNELKVQVTEINELKSMLLKMQAQLEAVSNSHTSSK